MVFLLSAAVYTSHNVYTLLKKKKKRKNLQLPLFRPGFLIKGIIHRQSF